MKVTKRQLRRIIERIGGGRRYSEIPAHPRDDLGKNIADVDFPILVRYGKYSEILYDEDSLDELLDSIGPHTPYSLDSLEDAEAADIPVGTGIERFAEVTKRQLQRIIKEEKHALLKEYSDYPSWTDLSDQIDDVSEMLDMAADKYVTSAWLFGGENEGNAIANGVAEKLEQLYRDAESLGGLIRGSGALKK